MGPKTVLFVEGSAGLLCFDAHTVYVGGLASNTHVWTVYVCGPRQEVKSEGDSGSWLPCFHLRFRRGDLGKHRRRPSLVWDNIAPLLAVCLTPPPSLLSWWQRDSWWH